LAHVEQHECVPPGIGYHGAAADLGLEGAADESSSSDDEPLYGALDVIDQEINLDAELLSLENQLSIRIEEVKPRRRWAAPDQAVTEPLVKGDRRVEVIDREPDAVDFA
jgi:hypothetical protein